MKSVSQAVVKRLPRYYRYLKSLKQAGVAKVSSRMLAEMLDITASQVRQDFCNFGGFGQQGYGYDVNKLLVEFARIMGLDKPHNIVIIGAGNIGKALVGYTGFLKENFYVTAIFDVNTDREDVQGIPLYHIDKLKEFCLDNSVEIAALCTQTGVANDVAKWIVDCGITSIWNFAPIILEIPETVTVENINMSESLYVLSYNSERKKRGLE